MISTELPFILQLWLQTETAAPSVREAVLYFRILNSSTITTNIAFNNNVTRKTFCVSYKYVYLHLYHIGICMYFYSNWYILNFFQIATAQDQINAMLIFMID